MKSLLLNQDVLAVLPTGYGKSLVFQCYVVAREVLENAKVSLLVVCPACNRDRFLIFRCPIFYILTWIQNKDFHLRLPLR